MALKDRGFYVSDIMKGGIPIADSELTGRHWNSRCKPAEGYHVWPCPECPEFITCPDCGLEIRQRNGIWVEDLSVIDQYHLAALHKLVRES